MSSVGCIVYRDSTVHVWRLFFEGLQGQSYDFVNRGTLHRRKHYTLNPKPSLQF